MAPWTKTELKEIARLRKQGRDDSYIRGWMKLGNKRKGNCPNLPKVNEDGNKKGRKKAGKKAR